MVFSIYIISNKINDKKYIGSTTKNPEIRWKSHINGKSKCKAINAAIKLYGVKNFTFEVIYNTKDFSELEKAEIYFIKEYNTFGENGYNLTMGGRGPNGYAHTPESKKLIKEKRKLQIMSDNFRKKASEHGKKGSEAYKKRYSEETRNKISIARRKT